MCAIHHAPKINYVVIKVIAETDLEDSLSCSWASGERHGIAPVYCNAIKKTRSTYNTI